MAPLVRPALPMAGRTPVCGAWAAAFGAPYGTSAHRVRQCGVRASASRRSTSSWGIRSDLPTAASTSRSAAS